MRATKYLLVTEEIAERAGLKDLRTKTEDGRYVLYEGDLKLVHLLPEEYVTGLQGVEVITEARAQELVEAAKAAAPEETKVTEETEEETPAEEETNDNDNEEDNHGTD